MQPRSPRRRGLAVAASALLAASPLAACSSQQGEAPDPKFTSIFATPTEAGSATSTPTEAESATSSPASISPAEARASISESPAPSSAAQDGIIRTARLGEAHQDASYPACDGRSILILDSVIDYGNSGQAADAVALEVLAQHPSGRAVEFTVSGQCPSLRAQLDGDNIYPIYLDFGSDASAMCSAKAAYGGNGRVLSNRDEYVDPC